MSRRSSSSSNSSGANMKQQTPVPMDTRKADDVKTWVNQHSRVENNDERQLTTTTRSDGEERVHYRPCTPPFPPPVTTPSSNNTVVKSNEISLSDGVHVNEKDIRLCVGEQHAKLTLDQNGNLKTDEVEQLRQSWESETQMLTDVKSNLEAMMRLPSDELRAVFTEKRKQKLFLMLR